ncbi:MAG TPA: heat-inducible transcriptional repressor HrcA [Gaiellaceae bacterium]|nr:heat-inducible transcriptional repressor HrcA [Gaiellaceae bacterium]
MTQRQSEILRLVVEEYVVTGQPVASKALVERTGLDVSPSTVRGELAELERQGLLTHPHTSAGRVPTEHGYRFFADRLLERLEPRPPSFPLQLAGARSELETALQLTTDMLSDLTRLLALVSAPAVETATVRHVEVLSLQPQVVMTVVITSTGSVTKRISRFEHAVDPGLVDWAGAYLNEQIVGTRLGSRTLRRALEDPSLSAVERRFLEELRPALESSELDERRVFVGGTASLLGDATADELRAYRGLLELVERRRALLGVVASAIDSRRPFVRVGDELGSPALNELALVGSTYGLATRTLGTVSLLGPLRMDYERAIRSVRSAASELSRLSENVYDED